MKRQHRGETRRFRIVRFLREHGPARHVDIARGVSLALSKSHSPVLDHHLRMLLADGYVRTDATGLRWEAAI